MNFVFLFQRSNFQKREGLGFVYLIIFEQEKYTSNGA